MNVVTGEIEEIYIENGQTKGKVRTKQSFVHVPLLLLMDLRVGDYVVVESGVALSKIKQEKIPHHTRKTANEAPNFLHAVNEE